MKSDKDDCDYEYDISRENNHVYFYSEVNRHTIYMLIGLLREAREYSAMTSMKLNIDEIPIYIHINSSGGFVTEAFAAMDIIQSCSVPIYSIVEGVAASAATLISVVCSKRFIRPNAQMLIHQLSSFVGGKMSEIEDELLNLSATMNKMKDIYSEHSSMTKKTINELLARDLWLDSRTAIKHGLVDEIWNKM